MASPSTPDLNATREADFAWRWRKIYGLRLGLADTWQGWVDREFYVCWLFYILQRHAISPTPNQKINNGIPLNPRPKRNARSRLQTFGVGDIAWRWRKIYGLRLGLADTWQGWVDREFYVQPQTINFPPTSRNITNSKSKDQQWHPPQPQT
jgi:hypothetical protein